MDQNLTRIENNEFLEYIEHFYHSDYYLVFTSLGGQILLRIPRPMVKYI